MSILSIVATPIGNLEDISLRALRVLREADLILCEDTRTTQHLLQHYQIRTKTISYHKYSQDSKLEKIIKLLRSGQNLALVSDAGTPAVSDPGSWLVSRVRQEFGSQLVIESIPGPAALTTALAIAGTGFDSFLFLGFLPHKKGRQTKLKDIFDSKYPVILYESKHRLLKLLEELQLLSVNLSSPLELRIARELTKLHESFYQGEINDLLKQLSENANNLKGEFVVLIKKLNK